MRAGVAATRTAAGQPTRIFRGCCRLADGAVGNQLRRAVVELGARADDGAAKPGHGTGHELTRGAHAPEHRKGQAVHARVERAQLLAKQRWQHGDDALHEVHGRRARARLGVERAALAHKVRDVGNVHADLKLVGRHLAHVQRVVEVARRRRVTGEDAQRTEVGAASELVGGDAPDALRRGRRARLDDDVALEASQRRHNCVVERLVGDAVGIEEGLRARSGDEGGRRGGRQVAAAAR